MNNKTRKKVALCLRWSALIICILILCFGLFLSAIWVNFYKLTREYKFSESTLPVTTMVRNYSNWFKASPFYVQIKFKYTGTPKQENAASRAFIEKHGDEPLIWAGITSAAGEETKAVTINDCFGSDIRTETYTYIRYCEFGYIDSARAMPPYELPLATGKIQYRIALDKSLAADFLRDYDLTVQFAPVPQNYKTRQLLGFMSISDRYLVPMVVLLPLMFVLPLLGIIVTPFSLWRIYHDRL